MLPMHVEDTKPYIQASVQMSNGVVVPAKLLVDSGASHGLVLDPSSNKEIFIPEKRAKSDRTRTGRDSLRVELAASGRDGRKVYH